MLKNAFVFIGTYVNFVVYYNYTNVDVETIDASSRLCKKTGGYYGYISLESA